MDELASRWRFGQAIVGSNFKSQNSIAEIKFGGKGFSSNCVPDKDGNEKRSKFRIFRVFHEIIEHCTPNQSSSRV